MVWVLGASGYIGTAFVRQLEARRIRHRAISRSTFDYTDYRFFSRHLASEKPDFVIQAAGFTGRPNVDACETMRAETVSGNLCLTLAVAIACAEKGVQMGHVSSGCIFTGAKIQSEAGLWQVTESLTDPLVAQLLAERSARMAGFRETDLPNFTFHQNNCSFYSGVKALTEEALQKFPGFFVWRLRIPFDEQKEARNYLMKVQSYPKIYQNWNSLSHREDFVKACLDLWEKGAPAGTYNLTNPGYVSTQEVVDQIQRRLRPDWQPVFWRDDGEFYRLGAKTPRSNCILDCEKAAQAGVRLRPVGEALLDALDRWPKE